MRFGAPLFDAYENSAQWVELLRRRGYRSAYCPVTADTRDSIIEEYASAARKADIVIAEVGVWNNVLDSDKARQESAIQYSITQLALAEKLGARCCVNISGSKAEGQGPHPKNLTKDTFEEVVFTVRRIIDAVKPETTAYTLEPMPWMYPHTADSYLELLQAVDRKAFKVHLDLVNVINSTEKYYDTGSVIREWVSKLGASIRSCHLKDMVIEEDLTLHLSEVIPGRGYFDYDTLLTELNTLCPDLPVLTEHLKTQEQYDEAERFIRSAANRLFISL